MIPDEGSLGMVTNKATDVVITLKGGAWPREARRVYELAAIEHVQLDPEMVDACDVRDLQRLAFQLQEHRIRPASRRWHLN
jgi:hypothetical protein